MWLSQNIVLTFDYNKSAPANSLINLDLKIKNQGESDITCEIKKLKSDEFMWVGKSKIIQVLKP